MYITSTLNVVILKKNLNPYGGGGMHIIQRSANHQKGVYITLVYTKSGRYHLQSHSRRQITDGTLAGDVTHDYDPPSGTHICY